MGSDPELVAAVLRLRIRMGPRHFGKKDPHQSGKLDPGPHQSEKVQALEGHFGALRVQMGKKLVVEYGSASD